MEQNGIAAIDLVVGNLYPFEATLASGADPATCIENIDIGGPAMIRAAAKNHGYVVVTTDPDDYPSLMAELEAQDGATSLALRARLATAAFAHTAAYDAAIAAWMQGRQGDVFPARLTLGARRRQVLRYGENPGVASAEQLQGKELSYNNLNDTEAAFELVSEFQAPDFDVPAVAIIKHANPCGVALGDTLAEAYARALACDPVSAFGGIIAVNRPLDGATAAAIGDLFAEVVIAPGYADEARAALAGKKNLRLLETSALADPGAPGMTFKSLAGGILLQTRDAGRIAREDLTVVTQRDPDDREMADLLFAFRVAKHVKSNAIVYVREGATVGVGAGQMSRVDSARIAALKAREAEAAAERAGSGAGALGTQGSVVASDAFFPFADGLITAIEAGATAVIQPGGSKRDDEVIAAADKAGVAMVFTGMRHFRH
jgi:phosphoribosylaminoimidazolecarboxamide formyltransferase/IMP cyclohydrolase